MAVASTASNHLTAAIASVSDEDARKKLLTQTHPLHDERSDAWRKLLDAFEGAGGFADGGYLWKYPNEKESEFEERQGMARYHNYAKSLVNIYIRHVFREGVKRESANAELTAWWENVDGARTPMSAFMKRAGRLFLVAGHGGVLVDKAPTVPTGPALADDTGAIFASVFPATAILDWREADGELVAVKLLETKDQPSITDELPTGDDTLQYLLWDKTAWARFDAAANVLEASPEDLGLALVPLVIGRPEPSAEHPFLGLSLLGDPNVYCALYNRCSEQDEVARDQAFSVLVVSVPAGKDVAPDAVAQAKQQLGTDIGTTRAIVVQGEVDYKTADMGVLEALGKMVEFLIGELYRAAHVRFENGSLDAESADAIRLQHTELNEMLANLAAELQRVELEAARFWCHWRFPDGDQAFEDAKVSISYPREFFIADLLEELQKWANAIKLDLGVEFEHYAKRRVVDQLAPELPADVKKKIQDEINTQTSTREQAMADAKERLAGSVAKFGAAGAAAGTP